MTEKLLYSAIAAAGLFGCAGSSTHETGTAGAGMTVRATSEVGTMTVQSCINQTVCKIPVKITDCSKDGGVSVPDRADVFDALVIQWDIATTGYQFKQPGVVIKDFHMQFDQHAYNPKRFTVRNKHAQLGPNAYAIYVMKDDGTPCVPLDPWINNR